MDFAELVGIVSERPHRFAWLLGAGASRSAGLRTATDIIWDLKRRYYCREENQEISQQDVQSEAVRERIQAFMNARGFPEAWAPEEYTTYFEKIFGSDYERQSAYLRSILSEDSASLSVGNRVLGALIAGGMARVVFTTNFDTIVEKSVAEVAGKALAPFHLEGPYAANNALDNEQYPIYCKLHGDFRYESIKNLADDLRAQNSELEKCFVNACNRFGLIVSGYSGRDASVMALLRAVLKTNNPFPGGLYWTTLARSQTPDAVNALIAHAKAAGVKAEVVSIETFDAFLLRLWRNIDDKPASLDAKVRKTQRTEVSIPLPGAGEGGTILRMNALPLSAVPQSCLSVTPKEAVDWEQLQALERESSGALLLACREKLLAFGLRSAVERAFKDNLVKIDPQSITAEVQDLKKNLYLKALLENALGRALCRGKPLICRFSGHRAHLIVNRHAKDQTALKPLAKVLGQLGGDIRGLFITVDGKEEPQQVSWAEAVQVSIEQKNGGYWIVLDPEVWVWPRTARRDATAFLDCRTGDRFNAKANDLLSAWCEIVLTTNDRSGEIRVSPFEGGDGSENPEFLMNPRTAFARRTSQ